MQKYERGRKEVSNKKELKRKRAQSVHKGVKFPAAVQKPLLSGGGWGQNFTENTASQPRVRSATYRVALMTLELGCIGYPDHDEKGERNIAPRLA